MTARQDYWQECIATAAEECDLKLTPEQLDYLAGAVENGHEHYGMAFYSPPPSERLSEIEDGWKKNLKALQAEFDAYKGHAETAVKQALRLHREALVSIEPHGEVLARWAHRADSVMPNAETVRLAESQSAPVKS